MLGIISEPIGGTGDQRWLYSRHSVENAATRTLDVSAFSTVAVDGVILSGTPVTEDVGGLMVPFTDGATQTLYGFVLTDQPTAHGDTPAPIVWHGRIRTDYLPGTFTAPASTQFLFD